MRGRNRPITRKQKLQRCALASQHGRKFKSAPMEHLPFDGIGAVTRYCRGLGLARLLNIGYRSHPPCFTGAADKTILLKNLEQTNEQPPISGTNTGKFHKLV